MNSSLPARFNFAEHLFALNRGRAARTAYIDDRGTLGYGQLEDRARRLAAALKAAGIRREERVLLLMLDGNDWPVSFLGCLYAGIVPVAVNTLLTPDDYAYMLDHSRAQAVLVSGALLPTLQDAMARGGHEVQTLFVSQPTGPLPEGAQEFEAALAAAEPLPAPRPPRRTTPASGSTPPAPPASPRARCTRTPTCGGPPSSTASPCSASPKATCASRPPRCTSRTAWAMR